MLDHAKLLIFLAGLAFSFSAQAIEYRSIALAKVITYDAPSREASKLYILGGGYPVEVIVNLGDWIKVRDNQGGLSWVESTSLSSKRTVLVLTKTDIKVAEDATSALVATVEKDVVLELLTGSANSNWVKVKHRDGATGFVQVDKLWGFN
ncbi:MAG TPA: SH3 domain-containing protein [Methylotenera sp.]|nr:SH3 domain-containing protein [Methylotenera sp.]